MTEHELDTLLRDYGGAVRSVCRAILPGHPQDAEEAEADTFYKLWRGAHLPADETHRRRLVVQAARQCAIDRYRALLRRGETLPLDDRDDAELAVALESELETRELMAQVMHCRRPTGSFFCAGTCMARPRPSWAYISTCLPQRCAPGCTAHGWHCKSY